MRKYLKLLFRFCAAEEGPTTVEYAVMLTLIVIVCMSAIGRVGTRATADFKKVAKSLK